MTFATTGGRRPLAMQGSFLLLSRGALMAQGFSPKYQDCQIHIKLENQAAVSMLLPQWQRCLWMLVECTPLHLSSWFWLCIAYRCWVGHRDHTTGVPKQEQKWDMTLQPGGVLRGAPQPGTLHHVCRAPMAHKLTHSHTAGLWKRVGKDGGVL